MFVAILLLLIFVACFASLMNSGLWSNTITFVNTITAALVATNYFEPLAEFFERNESSFAYVWDFIAVWLIFGLVFAALRAVTDYLSPVRVRFFMPVEKVGGPLMAVWVGWVMVCFATMTFHTAPLSRNFLGFQEQPDTKMLFGLAPDRLWLAWMHRESRGSLSRLGNPNPFDPRGEFILKYGNRRAEFDQQLTLTKPKGKAPAPVAAE